MTIGSLLILWLVVGGGIAALVSALTGLALPWLDRFSRILAVPARVGLWFGVALLPLLIALVLVSASMLPAFGLGTDHCLAHDSHHPHLCPNHAGALPSALTVLLAFAVAMRLLFASSRVFQAIRLSSSTSQSLAQASEEQNGVLVFDSDSPSAFVLGALRPRVHVSQALLSMGSAIVGPVLAHERAHAKHFDLLWRSLFPLLSVGHFRFIASALQSRLVLAQEMRADASAAVQVRNSLTVAEALLTLATLKKLPAPGLLFTDGDIDSRVRELLRSTKSSKRWPLQLCLAGALLGSALLVAHTYVPIHHALETLLGVLN